MFKQFVATTCLTTLLAAQTTLLATPAKPAARPLARHTAKPASSAAQEKARLMTELFDEDISDAMLAQKLVKARALNVPPQVLLEARLIHAVRGDDSDALAALLPAAQNAPHPVDLKNSQMFHSQGEFDGFVTGLKALTARDKGDVAGFEASIKQAFWLSPRFSSLYGGWIQEWKQDQKMATLTLRLDTPIVTSDGKRTTLKKVIGANKAALVDFWASWCGPCMMSMGETRARAHKLAPQGIVVIGMNVEHDKGKAAAVKQRLKMNLPWLVEPGNDPYSKTLDIDSIPHMALITPDGKVHFNGHPMSAKLNKALAEFGAHL